MVEHHAFGFAGRAARVDQQREVVVVDCVRCRDFGACLASDVGHVDRGEAVGGEFRAEIDDHTGSGVANLEVGFGGSECRIDRRGSGAQAPCREDRHDEFDPVGEHDREDIAGPEALVGELNGECVDALGELTVGELDVVVAKARTVGWIAGFVPGQVAGFHVRVEPFDQGV